MKARETVTDLLTAESMTATQAAREILSAAATTASSSELTTMRRTTAAKGRSAQSVRQRGEGMCPLGVSECSVLSGFFANVPCVFPFVYNGVEYNQCTFEDSEYRHDQPWYVDMICYEHFYNVVLSSYVGVPPQSRRAPSTSQGTGATVGRAARWRREGLRRR